MSLTPPMLPYPIHPPLTPPLHSVTMWVVSTPSVLRTSTAPMILDYSKEKENVPPYNHRSSYS